MPDDIIDLILADHAEFRRAFAELDGLTDHAELARRWLALADHLEVHASAEEEVFYPELLQEVDNSEGDTKHAVKDHNKIRDATRATGAHEVGTQAWWEAFRDARAETVDHLDEEENDVLPPFREQIDAQTRRRLATDWQAFHERHKRARGLSGEDKDPEDYVEDKATD